MRLGLVTGYSGPRMQSTIDLILEAERLGFDSVWSGEAYGSDVITFLAFVGARTSKIKLGAGIMQMHARTPAMAAMTAMTLDGLTNGRFIIGFGPSNPQVVEGWHGVPYGKPLQRYREYIAIVRKILAREAPLEFNGQEYQIPYRGPDATGLGKPLKSILHGRSEAVCAGAALSPVAHTEGVGRGGQLQRSAHVEGVPGITFAAQLSRLRTNPAGRWVNRQHPANSD